MQYSASNPMCAEFHFSALHHGDYSVVGQVVVCGCVSVHDMASNRGCAKNIQKTTSIGNYSTSFFIFCCLPGLMPQVLRYLLPHFLCEKRMVKEILPIIKWPQGSLDKNSTWVKGRYFWAMQLCVHFGIDIDLDPFLEEVNDFQVPPCFDQEQLVLLSTSETPVWMVLTLIAIIYTF